MPYGTFCRIVESSAVMTPPQEKEKISAGHNDNQSAYIYIYDQAYSWGGNPLWFLFFAIILLPEFQGMGDVINSLTYLTLPN